MASSILHSRGIHLAQIIGIRHESFEYFHIYSKCEFVWIALMHVIFRLKYKCHAFDPFSTLFSWFFFFLSKTKSTIPLKKSNPCGNILTQNFWVANSNCYLGFCYETFTQHNVHSSTIRIILEFKRMAWEMYAPSISLFSSSTILMPSHRHTQFLLMLAHPSIFRLLISSACTMLNTINYADRMSLS